MRKFLSHDATTGELRLVYADLYRGQHERTEYRVMSDREGGRPVRNMPERDGTPVLGTAPDLYIRGPMGGQLTVWTEQVAIAPTECTPCPRAANSRKRCALCQVTA